MSNPAKMACAVVALVAACLIAAFAASIEPAFSAPPAGSAGPADSSGGTAVLMTRALDSKTPTGTIWRTFETWQTDVARTADGKLVNVDTMNPRAGLDDKGQPVVARAGGGAPRTSSFAVNPAKTVHGSPWPAAGWQAPEFDDSNWTRDPCPQRQLYGLIALRCLRGKFQVTDETRAGNLSLTVRFRGGAVAYLNGKEIGRAFLPKGDLKPETLAEDYPKDAYVDADGVLISQGITGTFASPADSYNAGDPETAKRYKSRCRTLEATIPASLLHKGTNVLSIEIHRAAAWDGMFTSAGYVDRKKSLLNVSMSESWWDRAVLEDVKLTAQGNAVVPNVGPAKGYRVWNHPASQDIDPAWYGDPNDPLVPVRLRGLKNGSYSGMLVATSSDPIKGLEARVTELTGPAGTIPATAITVAYARLADGFLGKNLKGTGEGSAADGSGGWTMFDILDATAPKDIAKTQWSRGRTFEPMQPIWLTVRVPRDAKAGLYKGTVTVAAAGEKPVTTPLELEVVGDFCLPDASAFKTYVGMIECPDALAAFYKVQMWSDEHWKLVDKSFEVLGQIATKDLFVPLVARTHQGNRSSMVRWIKQPDGTYKADTSIAEKYMTTAIKHLGKIPVVCLFIAQRDQYAGDQPICTEYDPKTGETKDLLPPKWGTPEAIAFWKPVIDRMREFLTAQGMKDSMMFGYIAQDFGPASSGNAQNAPNYFTDLQQISPKTKWMITSHLVARSAKAGKLSYTDIVGGHSWMFGAINGAKWMDDSDTATWVPKYGWRDKTSYFELAASRSRHPGLDNDHCLQADRMRLAPEAVLLSQCGGCTWQGFGSWGADFWGNEWYTVGGGKGNQGATFANCGLSENTALWFVGPGEAGPVHSARTRMLQEGLQETEARIFVQDALLDQQPKLGPDLAKRAKELCDERTRMFTYLGNFRYNDSEGVMPRARFMPDPAGWELLSAKLYKLADEVAKATGKK